jgi:hypothetical protein
VFGADLTQNTGGGVFSTDDSMNNRDFFMRGEGGEGETVKRNDKKKRSFGLKKEIDSAPRSPVFKFSRNAEALCLKQKKHAR